MPRLPLNEQNLLGYGIKISRIDDIVDKEPVGDIQAFIGNRTVKQTWNKRSAMTQSCSTQRWKGVPQNTGAGQRRMFRGYQRSKDGCTICQGGTGGFR
jgi:hypothetical protein